MGYPVMVYGREKNLFAKFSDMIEGKPTLSGDFSFSGDLDHKVTLTVDLDEAFRKLSRSSD